MRASRALRVWLVATAFAVLAAAWAPTASAAGPTLRVGSLTLKRCSGARSWCGSLARPLDPGRPSGPSIRVGLKWIRAKDGAGGRPALVAVEGGPGYPSIGSEVEYRGIYGPLLRDRDLLLVDNRGTGSSALIDCKHLQSFTGVTSGPRFPGLVVGGDLDSLTPLSDARVLAPKLARTARVIGLPNTVHVTSEGDTTLSDGAACARTIIRSFVRAPKRLAALDARCAATIPAVHTPGAYSLRFAGVAPAAVVAGPDPGLEARRAAVLAANALADAVVRRFYSGVEKGSGLRGGRFTTSGEGPIAFRLRGVRYVSDATVDGSGAWTLEGGATSGELVVRPPGAGSVRVRVDWTQRSRAARARMGGSTLSLPAP